MDSYRNPSDGKDGRPRRDASVRGLDPRSLLRTGVEGVRTSKEYALKEDLIPGHRLVCKIGEGGLGEVFIAEQLEPVRRNVALKRLKRGLASSEWLQRFRIGMDALAQLDHPNIAKWYSAGCDQEGVPYYTMELVDGSPLSESMGSDSPDEQERLKIFGRICDAVQHAHQQGVIHGDLTPGNILIGQDEFGNPTPKLIDFGVARNLAALSRSEGEAPPIGSFGTVGYISPERIRKGRMADTASDVYALGKVFGEWLSMDLLPASLKREIRWIRDRAANDLPAHRYESVAEMASDIRAMMEDRPIAAGPETWTYRWGKHLKRHRRRLALGAVFGAAILWIGITLLFQGVRNRRADERVREATQRADVEWHRARLTEALVHGLVSGIQEPDLDRRQERIRGMIREVRGRADENAQQMDRDARISVRMALGAASRAIGEFEDAESDFLDARELALSPMFLRTRQSHGVSGALARLYMARKKWTNAQAILEDMVTHPVEGLPPHAVIEPLLDLAELCIRTGNMTRAKECIGSAREMSSRYADPDNPLALRARLTEARWEVESGRFSHAREILVPLLRAYETRFDPRAPEIWECRGLLKRVGRSDAPDPVREK